jgi:primosomal protein N' (replication factor Y)
MSTTANYVKVAFNLPVNKLFVYSTPPELRSQIALGKRVLAPFGSRKLTGYIVGFSSTSEFSGVKLILDVMDEKPLISSKLLRLTRWMAEYYLCPWGVCLAGTLPKGIDIKSQQLVSLTPQAEELLVGGKNMPGGVEGEILALLRQKKELALSRLKKKWDTKGLLTVISGLQQQGLISIENSLSAPRVKPLTQKYWQLAQPAALIKQELINLSRRAPRQAAVLSALLQAGGEMSLAQLKASGLSRPSITPLINKGLINETERPCLRRAYTEAVAPSCAPPLLPAQQAVVDLAASGLKRRQFLPVLLHGITGSGKTEVYLNLIEQTLAQGRQALVLVPEISLTAQLWQRFYSRFGQQVAVLHSQLSAGERLDEWCRLWRGEAAIAVGARSAVFAPLTDVGLIVVDEEHASSYKQENSPRYHAREVALIRGKLEQAVVIMGSATPSLESFYRCQFNGHHLASLPERVENRPLPRVEIVDMRRQLNEEFLSPRLVQALQQRLECGEQSLLFLNRRGFAPFILCPLCGEVVNCPHCSVSLTYHRQGRACCHYCGYSVTPPKSCPTCKGDKLQYFGMGTQRLESRLRGLFPDARIARMDRDTTSRKGAHWRIFRQLQTGQIDILIGTQMVTQGFDLPGITLVGVIAADLGLGMPDFRAGERTFQLLTQVAGRAGRGDTPGEVIIQTYNPQHYSIQAAKQHHYHQFYEQEIKFRRSLHYPPITKMVNLMLAGRQERQVAQAARWLAGRLKHNQAGIKILGPSPATITKIKDNTRWQLLLKGIRSSNLHSTLENVINSFQRQPAFKGVRIEVDVDPVNLL